MKGLMLICHVLFLLILFITDLQEVKDIRTSTVIMYAHTTYYCMLLLHDSSYTEMLEVDWSLVHGVLI